MSLTERQQAAAYATGSVAVTAGAGTGKTHMLAERYLFHLKQGFSPLEIVATTFTDKAAAELRSRIRRLVAQQLPHQLELLAELEAAQISTLHALAARICREHPDESGAPPSFTMLDDLESKLWQSEQLASALNALPIELYQKIPYSLMEKVLKALLDDPITAEQALKQDDTAWADLVTQIREKALEELLNHPIWNEAHTVLNSYAGTNGDGLENNRLIAVGAITQIEQSINVNGSLQEIRELSLRSKGSAKNWQSGGQEEVQESLKALKEHVKKTLEKGLITLELGEADARLAGTLPVLREAFQFVQNLFNQAKRRSRVLTYADLEVCALKALRNSKVCAYYARRWKAFLIDEFQDINPVQAALLKTLTSAACLTIVGDVKQAIYGFRRADVEIFDQFRKQIHSRGGAEVYLERSFRTHHTLITQINQIFAPVLAPLYQSLEAHRTQEPHLAPHLRVFTIQADKGINKPQRQQAEAYHIAQALRQMIDSGTLVHDKSLDKSTDQLRPMRYGDIAILSRTRDPLELYGETLEAQGIPAVETGGGDLLATRTAKDMLALLRFLADPKDDLALVAVLRSPFFALSDRILFRLVRETIDEASSVTDVALSSDEELANSLRARTAETWWQWVKTGDSPELTYPVKVLNQLLGERQAEPPSRLLQIADRLTGYTAVLANLSGADRRMADWRGLRELVVKLEQGNSDLFSVVRRCKQLIEAEVEVPRPTLEAQNAVALMTIHAAKGLEWAVVVVPDLTRSKPADTRSIYFDPNLGAALKWNDEADNEQKQKPALYIYLEHLKKQREAAEAKRILYVVLTRARDHLLLTATDEQGNGLDILRPGLAEAGVEIVSIPFSPEAAIPVAPPNPQLPAQLSRLLLGPVGSGLWELPVTALSDYARCPKRFQFRFIEGHPGMGEGIGMARRVGTLVHKALELDIRDINALASFDATLPQESVREAVELAQRFDQSTTFANVRDTSTGREQAITFKKGKLTLNGVVDLVGKDWVLDFKTSKEIHPEYLRFQLWAYAAAMGHSTAHIAYLRDDILHTFSPEKIQATAHEASALVENILAARYPTKPSQENCTFCLYQEVCKEKHIA